MTARDALGGRPIAIATYSQYHFWRRRRSGFLFRREQFLRPEEWIALRQSLAAQPYKNYVLSMPPANYGTEEPYMPGGCVAQAWGVAELLRCLLKTES